MAFFDDIGLSNKTLGGISDALAPIGGAAKDFFAAEGAQVSANQYFGAAEEDYLKASLARQQETLQTYSAQRKIAETQGGTAAAVGAAGFQQSGTGLDLLRQGQQQGYLTLATIGEQGEVTAASYTDAAKAAWAEGKAAQGSIFGDILGGIAQVGGAALKIGAMIP